MKINTLYQTNYIMGEGIDASGKTTQIVLATEYFRKKGYDLMQTRQPGGTAIGKKIREILLDPENSEMDPDTELLLYMGDRNQHMKQVIIPNLQKQNKILFQDKGQFASKTYQGYARGFNLEHIDWLHDNIAVGKYHPDSVLFFDISVEESRKRLGARNKELNMEKDRLEKEDREFFQRIRDGMYECKKQNPDLITIIDAERPIEEIHRDVISHIEKLIQEKNKIFQFK